jgi:hypothetical protein
VLGTKCCGIMVVQYPVLTMLLSCPFGPGCDILAMMLSSEVYKSLRDCQNRQPKLLVDDNVSVKRHRKK